MNQYDASASFAGYLYQCRMALLLALRRYRVDTAVQVRIEKFDDITFENAGSIYERIQTKHHAVPKSIADRSPDLWKTVRIWSEAVASHELDPKSTALLLLTNSTATDGSIASLLRTNLRQADLAVDALRNIAGEKTNAENQAGYSAFSALSPRQQQSLVKAIYVLDSMPGAVDVIDEYEAELTYIVERKFLIPLIERLEGWWLHKIIARLSGQVDDAISGTEIESKILSIADGFKQDNLTIDFLFSQPPDGIDTAGDQRMFVQQLRLIALSHPRIADAILDYYRAFQQRSKWLREDQLLLEELDIYEKRLIDEWRRQYNRMTEELGEPENEQVLRLAGKRLFNWMSDDAEIHIRPRCKEPYVLRGSYHILADDQRVGWHPQFVERLKAVLLSDKK